MRASIRLRAGDTVSLTTGGVVRVSVPTSSRKRSTVSLRPVTGLLRNDLNALALAFRR